MDLDDFDEVQNDQDQPVDPAVTVKLFSEWRAPRFGRANPERMNNPVWEWLIRSRLSAFSATEKLGGEEKFVAGPGWSFSRFGQSKTSLPDGRVVFIAGEHEDFYDSDFNIYNDVVVQHPDGGLDIWGYPQEVFPPTDFHSATLADNRIVLIGSLGYPEQRKHGITQVGVLDLTNFSVSLIAAKGSSPSWLYKHEALLEESGESILVRRGMLDCGGSNFSLVENIDDWRLCLSDWRWERLTDRRWPRWEIVREDGLPNHLWEIQQALWNRDNGWKQELEEALARLRLELNILPDLDLATKIFRPPVPHESMPQIESEYNVERIRVMGVIVRYVVDMHSIQLTVEGSLPSAILSQLSKDLCQKLSKLENAPFMAKPIG